MTREETSQKMGGEKYTQMEEEINAWMKIKQWTLTNWWIWLSTTANKRRYTCMLLYEVVAHGVVSCYVDKQSVAAFFMDATPHEDAT